MHGDAWANLLDVIAARTGLAVQTAWRRRLEAVIEEISASMGAGSGQPVSAYLEQSAIDAPIWRRILSAVTIGETRFLRHKSWFAQLERLVLIPLIDLRRRENVLKLHLWSAGCSTGEEAYTLALLLRKLLPDIAAWDIDIHATDIRQEAIEAARLGEYDRRQLREIGEGDIPKFFAPRPSALLAVSPALRDMVGFHVENLADSASIKAASPYFDLILCRNVLMYLKPEMQRNVAAYLTRSLSDRGWLAVSPAEASAEWFKPLVPVNVPEAIFFTRHPAPSPDKRPDVAPIEPIAYETIRVEMPAVSPLAVAKDSLEELRSLADRGDLVEARRRCQSLLALDGLDGDANILLAEICSELNDAPAAYAAAKRAVYLSPASSHAQMLLAGALSRLGHRARARKAWMAARTLAQAEADPSTARLDAESVKAGLPGGRDGSCQA